MEVTRNCVCFCEESATTAVVSLPLSTECRWTLFTGSLSQFGERAHLDCVYVCACTECRHMGEVDTGVLHSQLRKWQMTPDDRKWRVAFRCQCFLGNSPMLLGVEVFTSNLPRMRREQKCFDTSVKQSLDSGCPKHTVLYRLRPWRAKVKLCKV